MDTVVSQKCGTESQEREGRGWIQKPDLARYGVIIIIIIKNKLGMNKANFYLAFEHRGDLPNEKHSFEGGVLKGQ